MVLINILVCSGYCQLTASACSVSDSWAQITGINPIYVYSFMYLFIYFVILLYKMRAVKYTV